MKRPGVDSVVGVLSLLAGALAVAIVAATPAQAADLAPAPGLSCAWLQPQKYGPPKRVTVRVLDFQKLTDGKAGAWVIDADRGWALAYLSDLTECYS